VLIEKIRRTLQDQPAAAARLTWLARLQEGTLERLQTGDARSFTQDRLRKIYEHLLGQTHGLGGQFAPKVTEIKRDYQVTIPPDVASRLHGFGSGNLSAGITTAAALVRERAGADTVLPAPPRGRYPNKGVAGRKRLGKDARTRRCVKLLPAVRDQLYKFGDKNLSAGIERVSLEIANWSSSPAESNPQGTPPAVKSSAKSLNKTHPNRNWKHLWTVDLLKRQATHVSGFAVQILPDVHGWEAVEIEGTSDVKDDAQTPIGNWAFEDGMKAKLMQQAVQKYRLALRRSQREGT
jgi:hypothetical protein